MLTTMTMIRAKKAISREYYGVNARKTAVVTSVAVDGGSSGAVKRRMLAQGHTQRSASRIGSGCVGGKSSGFSLPSRIDESHTYGMLARCIVQRDVLSCCQTPEKRGIDFS